MRDIKPSVLSKILDHSVIDNLDRTSYHAEFEGLFLLLFRLTYAFIRILLIQTSKR